MTTSPLKFLSEKKLSELRQNITANRDRYEAADFLDYTAAAGLVQRDSHPTGDAVREVNSGAVANSPTGPEAAALLDLQHLRDVEVGRHVSARGVEHPALPPPTLPDHGHDAAVDPRGA